MKNKVGISTGCYYPRLTEDIIKDISETGVSVIELFINTHSEMSDGYIKDLLKKTDHYGLRVGSVHPFSSFAESYLFFSDYSRRIQDGLEIYDRIFEVCNILGANIVNFHGMRSDFDVTFERYCEGYSMLFERAKKSGVIFSQENVRQHVCGNLDYVKRLSSYLGDNVAFTFDIKQSHMMGYDPIEFIDYVSNKLCLVHLNDFDSNRSCLLPGQGKFDIKKFITKLNLSGYSGNYILEVYSRNYAHESEINDSVKYTQQVIKECLT